MTVHVVRADDDVLAVFADLEAAHAFAEERVGWVEEHPVRPQSPFLASCVEEIDREIRELQEQRDSIIRRNSHFRCDSCDWYCSDLTCTEEHRTHDPR